MEAKDSFWLRDFENEKPSLSIRLGRLGYRIRDILYEIKYIVQKIFYRDHLSDMDIWNIGNSMAKIIFKRLSRFKKLERHGYPSYFSEYRKNEWESKEAYEKAVNEGKIDCDVAEGKISGIEKWEQTLDAMLFSFEWIANIEWRSGDEKDKISEAFYKKYGLKNPYAEIEENKYVNYVYEMLPEYKKELEEREDYKEFGGLSNETLSGECNLHIKEPEKYRLLGSRERYFNSKYEIEVIEKKVSEGLELFGKFYRSLWD